MRSVGSRAAVGLIVVASAAVAFPGLVDRDLTGDELGTLGNTLGEMLDRSVETHRPDQFSAHVPLAWVIRHVFLSVLGDDWILPWRLHAALGHIVGALATWAVIRRHRPAGLALGTALIVALHPIAAFHAHDSTNYALDALTGALTLGGLLALAENKPRAGVLLGAGLLLGFLNDYYFFFVAPGALAATVWIARDPSTRRAALQAWGAAAVVVLPAAALALIRFRGTRFGDLIARHANPADLDRTLTTQAQLAGHWFTLSWFDGYEAHARPTPDLAWIAPIVLLAALVAAVRGDRIARIAALLPATAFAGMLAVVLVFPSATGLEFPVHPRNYLIVLPAIALLVADLAAVRPRVGVVFGASLLFLLGAASMRQSLNVTAGRAWAAGEIERRLQPGDRILSQVPMRFRLGPEALAATSQRWCVPSGPPPPRLWLVTFPGGPRPDQLGVCADEERPVGALPPLEGYRVRWVEDRESAPHESPLTNAYLTFTRLFLLDRTAAQHDDGARSVVTNRRFLDGAHGTTLVFAYDDPRGGGYQREPWSPDARWTAPPGLTAVRVELDAGIETPLHQTQPRPWVVDPAVDELSLQLTTLGDPRYIVARRVAAWILLLAVPLAIVRR